MIALLGFLPLALGALLGWLVWKGAQVPAEERSADWPSATLQLGAGAVICLLIGGGMVFFGMRMAGRADSSEPYSQSKPRVRF